MFNKPQEQKPAETKEPTYNAVFAVMVDCLDRINEKLAEIQGVQMRAPQERQEIITLSVNPHIYDGKGYKYWGLYASNAGTVHVNAAGIKYDQALTAGFNKVVLPTGATLTMDDATPLLAVWSDHLEI